MAGNSARENAINGKRESGPSGPRGVHVVGGELRVIIVQSWARSRGMSGLKNSLAEPHPRARGSGVKLDCDLYIPFGHKML